MHRYSTPLASLLLGASLLASCAAPASSSEVSVVQVPNYIEGQASPFAVSVQQSGEPVKGQSLSASFEMARMDHGQLDAVLTETDPGVYQAEVELPMEGEWIVDIEGIEGFDEPLTIDVKKASN